MRRQLLIGLLCLVGGACSNPTPEELASLAAKGYYEHLVRGEYSHFFEGKAGVDSIPDDYREQLLIAYKQFVALQEKDHHGIHEMDQVRHLQMHNRPRRHISCTD